MSQSDSAADGTLSLSEISSGVCQCVGVTGQDQAQLRLKRMGICEGQDIHVLHRGDPMILGVVGARIAVSRLLAQSVRVVHASSTAGDS